MISRQTKAFFLFSSLPIVFVGGATAWLMIYALYLQHNGQATYFVVTHMHWLRLTLVALVLFPYALISFFFDQRNAIRK
jgi:cytochrome c oxidase subunit IV